jgi:hypothetical protein
MENFLAKSLSLTAIWWFYLTRKSERGRKMKIDFRVLGVLVLVVLALLIGVWNALLPRPHIVLLIDKSASAFTNDGSNPKDPRYEFRNVVIETINLLIKPELNARISIITMCSEVEIPNPGVEITSGSLDRIWKQIKSPCASDGSLFNRGLLTAQSEFSAIGSPKASLIFLTDFAADNDRKKEIPAIGKRAKEIIDNNKVTWVLLGGVKGKYITDAREAFGVFTASPTSKKVSIYPTGATIEALKNILGL